MRSRGLAAILACGVAAAVPASSQGPTFRARTDVVRVDALVTDRGAVVRSLRPADFEVFDNGVRQDVDFAHFEEIPVNAILVLDMSASVAGDRLDHLRRASHVLVDALKKGDRAAVIGFSHFVEFGALTTELPSVVASLERMQPAGGTSLRDAAYAGLLMGETDEGRSLAIVFSDGVDTTSWLTPEAVIDTAKRSMSTVVYGVSVAGSRAAFLRQLTTDTGGSIFEVESTKNLDAVFVKVLSEFRGRYLVSYSPNGVLKGGWHRLEVRIKGRSNLAVKTRPGYLAS